MRIKKELQKKLNEKNLMIKDFEIGLTDGEKHKYFVYNSCTMNFKFGANTQDEILEILS